MVSGEREWKVVVKSVEVEVVVVVKLGNGCCDEWIRLGNEQRNKR